MFRRTLTAVAALAAVLAASVTSGHAGKSNDTLNWATIREVAVVDPYYNNTRELEIMELVGLPRRVAIPTESQTPAGLPHLTRRLEHEIIPSFKAIGFSCQVFANPVSGCGPVLLAARLENPSLPTVLGYGHGDAIRGLEEHRTNGAGPWQTARDGERLYDRGTADNKGQHTINMAAMKAGIEERGRLGFNAKVMIEMGEENGSLGVHQIIATNKAAFKAGVFIGSDGPRVRMDRPTISLGARGAMNFDLVCDLREGGHHSENWGGALADPAALLAHAIATIVSPTGEIKVKAWRPKLGAPRRYPQRARMPCKRSNLTVAQRGRKSIRIGEDRDSHRRIDLQRPVHRPTRYAGHLDPALLCRLLATCTRRTHPDAGLAKRT